MQIVIGTAVAAGLALFIGIEVRGIVSISVALARRGLGQRVSWYSLLIFAPFILPFLPVSIAALWGVDVQSGSPRAGVVLGLGCLITCYLGIRAIVYWVDSLPKAPRPRTPPDRPYGMFALTSAALMICAPAFALFLGSGWHQAGRLLQLLMATTLFLFSQSQRQFARGQSGNALSDPRGHCLYLRRFDTEETVFARRRRTGLWRWIPVPDDTVSSSGIPTVGYSSFEHFLAPPLNRRFAPMVALNNPYDVLPIPHGAIRIDATDSDWQIKVAALIDSSNCILATPAQVSRNLRWELDYILRHGFAHKLLLCTAPPNSDRWESLYLTFYALLFGPEVKTYLGMKRVPWGETVRFLEDVGYKPPIRDPGDGTVIAFNRYGLARVLTTGSESAAQYIDAILHYLHRSKVSEAHQKI